jgi:DNA-directed RNA polymerase subunit beta
VRLRRETHPDLPEEDIYLGEFPIMMGGGEFIVNGAERVIVSQLHRSPGRGLLDRVQRGGPPAALGARHPRARLVDRAGGDEEGRAGDADRPVDQARGDDVPALPRRVGRLDRRDHQPVLRGQRGQGGGCPPRGLRGRVDHRHRDGRGAGARGSADRRGGAEAIHGTAAQDGAVIQNPSDPLILNTIAEEKLEQFDADNDHEPALLKVYGKLRPGNPPQVDKAKQLFHEKFFDENRYRLGRVGRFRINRKFDLDVARGPDVHPGEDFLRVIQYILDLRSTARPGDGPPVAQVDDIDHLGNRRLRTLDELAVEELRKGFLKLRRTVQERMSVKDPDEVAKIADLVNSKSISSAIDFFFGRSELSQVVDQTNPLSSLVHERRLSALGPGGLNRKRAGFEVRDVHISHYGRVCPIETPEGTNIGLIVSLGIFSSVDEYGFLRTPVPHRRGGKVTDEDRRPPRRRGDPRGPRADRRARAGRHAQGGRRARPRRRRAPRGRTPARSTTSTSRRSRSSASRRR